MSVRIQRHQFTDEQRQTIADILILQPKEKYQPRRNYYSRATTTKPPLKLFYVDTQSDEVIVPYTFYRGLTGKFPNAEKSFPLVPFSFHGELFDIQQPLADEAMSQLETYGTTTLNLYTGSGKTVVAAYLAAKLGMLTIVFYASTVLEPQWKSTFEQFTDVRVWVVGQDPPAEGAHIILCMDTRFSKIPTEYVKQIGTVIFDEAHEFCTPTRINCILGVQPKYIIAATATLEREDGMHKVIHAMCGTHNVKKISKKPFNVYRYLTGIDIPLEKNVQGVSDWPKYCRNLCTCEERNIMILDAVRKNPDRKILILTWRQDHVTFLHDCFVKMGISVDKMAGNKKTYNDSRVLVGTISKIGTGFDEKAACENFNGIRINMLLLVGTMKNVGLLEQVAGRCFRADFPHIVYFVDSSKISENHWRVAKKWFLSRNGKILEIKSSKMAGTGNTDNTQSAELSHFNSIVQSNINIIDISNKPNININDISNKPNINIVNNQSQPNINIVNSGKDEADPIVLGSNTQINIQPSAIYIQPQINSSKVDDKVDDATVNSQLKFLEINGYLP